MGDAAIDGSHIRALKGGSHRTFAGRPGAPWHQHHLIADRHGTALAVSLTIGNRHDVTQLMRLLDTIPLIRGIVGRPRRRGGSNGTKRSHRSSGTRPSHTCRTLSRSSPRAELILK
ncbi:transposase [Streptomyces sp. NPDC087908]|uniref:transposase n=1 Tax=Streptomyces sp. NPDC087908 TaxID=3365820 RepID=UPI0037FCC0DD